MLHVPQLCQDYPSFSKIINIGVGADVFFGGEQLTHAQIFSINNPNFHGLTLPKFLLARLNFRTFYSLTCKISYNTDFFLSFWNKRKFSLAWQPVLCPNFRFWLSLGSAPAPDVPRLCHSASAKNKCNIFDFKIIYKALQADTAFGKKDTSLQQA